MNNKKNTFTKEFLIMQRAEKAILSRDYASAIRLYVRLLKSDPNNIDMLSKLGFVYTAAGDDVNALKIYTTVIQCDSSNITALNNLGGIYRRLGRYEESIKCIEKVRKFGVNSDEIAYNEGYTYKLMGKHDEAVNCFLNAIEKNPNDVLAYNHLGTIEDLRGNPEKALAAFSRGLQIDPNHPILHYNLALHFSAQNKPEEAAKHFEAALRVKPNWNEALSTYSELLIKINQSDRAEEVLMQNIKLNPENIDTYNKLGQLYTVKGAFAKAELAYLKVLERDSENMCALSGLGKVYDKQKKYFDAAAIMERLGKLRSDDTETSLHYAKILVELNRFKDAALLLKKIYDTDPNNIVTLNVLGQYFARKDEIKKAYICYRRIFRNDPEASLFLKDNAAQFMYTGRFENARQLLQEYLKRCSNDADTWAELAKCYKALGEYKKALKALSRSLNIDSTNFAAIEQLGSLIQYLNEDSNAMSLIAELLNKNNTTDSDLDTLLSSMAAREHVLDAIEKNGTTPIQAEKPVQNEDDDDFSFLNNESKFRSLYREEDENEIIKLDISPDDVDFSDDYDLLSLAEPSDKTESVRKKDEPFDFSGLFPADSPLEFDLNGEENPFDDFFDKKNSQHYDPVEEEEFLTVEGSGFEPEDTGKETEKKYSAPDSLVPPIQTEHSPVQTQWPPLPQMQMPMPQVQMSGVQAGMPNESYRQDFHPYHPPQKFEKAVSNENFVPAKNSPRQKERNEKPLFETWEDVSPEKDRINTENPPDAERTAVTEKQNDTDAPFEENFEEFSDFFDPEKEPAVKDTQQPADANGTSGIPGGKPEAEKDDTDFPIEVIGQEEESELPVYEDKEETLPTAEQESTAENQNENEDFDKLLMKQVRKVLNDVFDTSPIEEFSRTFEMFDSLRKLCSYLPDEKKEAFFSDLNRVKLDYVIDRLQGKPGLLSAAQALHENGLAELYTGVKKKVFLERTLSYMNSLVKTLSDTGHAKALHNELCKIINGLAKK